MLRISGSVKMGMRGVLAVAVFVLAMLAFPGMTVQAGGKGTLVTPSAEVTGISLKAADYNQRNKVWSADKLGKSSTDMYHSGCMICCVAAASKLQGGVDMTPGAWNTFCSSKQIYTKGGAIMWDQLAKSPAALSVSTGTKLSGKSLTKLLEKGQYPIIKVKRASGAYHWILLTGTKDGDFTCLDPIEGDITLSYYQDQIYAVRVLTVVSS